MEKFSKRKIILALILVAIISVSVIGTYAYFLTSAGRNEEQKLTVTTGTLSLVFEDNDEGLTDQIMLGESKSKEFRIRNTGTESVTTNMLFSGLVNTYIEESLSYTLEYKTSEDGDWQPVTTTSHTNIPNSDSAKDYNLATGLTIPAGATYYYKLTITFNNLPDINQESDRTAILSAKFKLGDEIIETKNILMAVEKTYSDSGSINGTTGKIWEHKSDITSIVFENTINPKENYAYTYDLSDSESEGPITAYLISNKDDSTKYTAYIQADGKIMANPDSSYLFYNFTNLQNIIGLENLDTSNVTSMRYMFYFCKFISLDLSTFNTRKVTDMFGLLYECRELEELNISSFKTYNVINMGNMFARCWALKELDVSKFVTNNVTNMHAMFWGCRSLTNINIDNFNTSNVTDMSSMFQDCDNITSINLSNLDTHNVTNMHSMFEECNALQSLDLSNFNTNKVTNMSWMFWGCNSLKALNVSSFDTSNVTGGGFAKGMQNMFNNCKSLISLDLSNFDTSNITDMSNMFDGCSSLTSLNVNNFNTSKVTDMSHMFNNCSKLTSLNLSSFNTSNVTNMTYMFQGCTSLTALNIRNFDTKASNSYLLGNQASGTGVPTTIKITVKDENLKAWVKECGYGITLPDSNFIVG